LKFWPGIKAELFFSVVKRGCALEDTRYNGTGCEEQITAPGIK
jgi:hypothetical protein